jgi:hypothetical protein
VYRLQLAVASLSHYLHPTPPFNPITMIFGGLEFVALHHIGAWIGTHLATGAAHGALNAGNAIIHQTTQHVGDVIVQHVATGAAKNVGQAASSNFWTWVGTLL